jgi:hypothetical protein
MIALMISAAALVLPVTGCAGDEVVYDPYRHDYHRWNSGEDRFYRLWEIRTHRPHMDFQTRSPEDQRAYWGSRHVSYPTSYGRHQGR